MQVSTRERIGWIWGLPRRLAGQVGDTFRLGFKATLVAPLILAIVALPEFVQHVAEIDMGMFVSNDGISAGAEEARRWSFGYVKIAGLVAGMLLTLRYWLVSGSLRRALTPSLTGIGRFLRVLLVFVLLNQVDIHSLAAANWLGMSPGAAQLVSVVIGLVLFAVQILLLLWIVAAFGGDMRMTPSRSAKLGWRHLPSAVLLPVIAFMPWMAIHQTLNNVAWGAAPAIVWPLMITDALVVGLLATTVGSALYIWYRDASASLAG